MNDHFDESSIKDRILEQLISLMEERHGSDLASRFPKAPPMAVEVAAPDKAGLKEGLDKAGDVLDHAPLPGEEGSKEEEASESPKDEDDESRLLELLKDDEDKEEEEPKKA